MGAAVSVSLTLPAQPGCAKAGLAFSVGPDADTSSLQAPGFSWKPGLTMLNILAIIKKIQIALAEDSGYNGFKVIYLWEMAF